MDPDDFEALFGAPHAVDFGALAAAHGLAFARVETDEALATALAERVDFIEAVPAPSRPENVKAHAALEAPAVAAAGAVFVGGAERGAERRGFADLRFERWSGDGPPVMLLHGLFGSRADVRRLRADAFPDRAAVLVDLPGHGESGGGLACAFDAQVEAVLALCDRLDLVEPDLAGYSLGGRIALGCKRAAPDRVGRVVALSARLAGLADADKADRRARAAADAATATRVRALASDDDWRRFYDDWYAGDAKDGIWGRLRADRAAYARRRRDFPPGFLSPATCFFFERNIRVGAAAVAATCFFFRRGIRAGSFDGSTEPRPVFTNGPSASEPRRRCLLGRSSRGGCRDPSLQSNNAGTTRSSSGASRARRRTRPRVSKKRVSRARRISSTSPAATTCSSSTGPPMQESRATAPRFQTRGRSTRATRSSTRRPTRPRPSSVGS